MDKQNLVISEIDNPYRNVYWFSRMLINNDKYGGIGKNSKLLALLTSQLRNILETGGFDDTTLVEICIQTIRNTLQEKYKNAKAIKDRVASFCNDVAEKISTIQDVHVFILTAEMVMTPINIALDSIPNNDREFTTETSRAYLDKLGEKGLATVINIWDDLGVQGSLTAERVSVVREFSKLRRDISFLNSEEENLILTAFVQEFERRLGQKRKSRAGGSLEDVASFIFDYYGIHAANSPEHFQADIEVDKWVQCADKWLIGISCKRTLRERWKQVSSADRLTLSRYKIKQIWHLITYDEDLSDDKLTLLGGLDHIFYLRDDSRKLANAKSNIGMRNFVRPMSSFVADIKFEQTNH